MPEVVRQEDPVEPVSLSGFWRTVVIQMEVYRDRPAPAVAMLLFLASVVASVYRMFSPGAVDPRMAGACLTWDALFHPAPSKWSRYLLHLLWPVEPGYIRAFLVNTVLIVEGYALEYEIGTAKFLGLFTGCHLASAAILLYNRFTICHFSLEPVLVAMAAVMHCVNPKLHSDGLDKSVRVPFAVEPRWHLWLLLGTLLLMSSDFPQTLAGHAVGLLVGAVCALRDPDAWQGSLQALRSMSFTFGAGVHVVLLLAAVLFMPISARELPGGLPAYLNGRARASPPAFYVLDREAQVICKLVLVSACPLLLSPFRIWAKFYSGACVLLVMYSMNSGVFRYPHAGFVTLVYLVWAFWKLPSMEFARLKAS